MKKNNALEFYNFPAELKDVLKKTALTALKNKSKTKCRNVCIVLLGQKEMLKLNKKYLNSSKDTDIISFTYSPNPLSGDIFISKEQSKKQAKALGHSWKEELKYLIIHGILHLFGYRDYTAKEKKNMFKVQDKIFCSIKAF